MHRPDGDTSTMLRKVATKSRDGDVWVPSKTCVRSGEHVVCLWQVPHFVWVRTDAGVEGYMIGAYFHASACCPEPQV